MGLCVKLGHRMVRIWRWIARLRKRGCYSRLHHENSRKFRHWHFPVYFHISHSYKKEGFGYYESERFNQVSKGFLAVYVGEGEEHQRFEIPVPYFNHPLFGELLKEAEEEYGFDQKGALTIPCELSHFEKVQSLISQSASKHKHP